MSRIFKKNNSYYFSVEVGKDKAGKRQRMVRGGFRTKKEAQKAASELEFKFNTGNIIIKPVDITLHEFMWEHWLMYHSRFVKPSTVYGNIKVSLARIDRYFGDKIKLKDITPYKCALFAGALMEEFGLKREPAKTTLLYLKIIFRYAVQIEKLLIQNPCENIAIPRYTIEQKEMIKKTEKKKLLFLEKDQLKKFLDLAACDGHAFPYYTAVLLLAYTGIRAGELEALQWDDIDMKKKVMHIKHTLHRPGRNYILQSAKTTGSIRDIVLSDTVINHLKKYRRQYLMFKLQTGGKWDGGDYDFVIVSCAHPGRPLAQATFQRWIDKIAQKAKLPHIHPHVFRHTHVSLLAEAGVPLTAIAERLGHSHDRTTEEIYLHITKKFKKDTAEKFEKLLSRM